MQIIMRDMAHNAIDNIIYYVSEKNEKIYINNIINCKQDFKIFLKLHNYFKNYYIF